MRSARPPTPRSLVDLLNLGFLSEEDVQPGGHVDEARRRAAERAAAVAVSPPRTVPPPRTDPAPPPTPRRRRVTPSPPSAAHVHRVRVRRTALGAERLPQPLVLDACCICYSRPRDHAFAPCFHMCVCAVCAEADLSRCPLCRAEVRAVHRIYAE